MWAAAVQVVAVTSATRMVALTAVVALVGLFIRTVISLMLVPIL